LHHDLQSPNLAAALDGGNPALLTISARWPTASSEPHCQLRHGGAFGTVWLEEIPDQVLAAWKYSLDTMMQQASAKQTRSWKLDGIEDDAEGDYGDDDITLRRV